MERDPAAATPSPPQQARAEAGEPDLLPAPLPISDELAAPVLVEHLYQRSAGSIPFAEVGQLYRAGADGARIGGDLVDVYHYDSGATSFTVADVSGRGVKAAVHTALIKFGLRAYTSHGLTAEEAIRSLNTLYIENSSFEDLESFVSVFFGIVDPERRTINYASAGHEPVVLFNPGEPPAVLPPTGPIIGIDGDRRIFRQRFLPLGGGAILAAFTDGVTEARSPAGAMLGMDGAVAHLARRLSDPTEMQARRLLDAAQRGSRRRSHHPDAGTAAASRCSIRSTIARGVS